jgi:hypothetical protein
MLTIKSLSQSFASIILALVCATLISCATVANACTENKKPEIKQVKQRSALQFRKNLLPIPQSFRDIDGEEEIILDTVLGRSTRVPYDSMDIARLLEKANSYYSLAGMTQGLLSDTDQPEFEFAEQPTTTPQLFGKLESDGYQPFGGPKYYIKNPEAGKTQSVKPVGKTPAYGNIYLLDRR